MAAFLLVFHACQGSHAPDSVSSESDADTDSDTDTDTDADGDADTDSGPPATATLDGVVTDVAGNSIEDARVNVCRDVCKYVFTDGAGAYAFSKLEAWTASFYVIPPKGSSYAYPIVPVTLADKEQRTIDMVLLDLDAAAPLPDAPQEVEVVEGVYLTVGASVLEPVQFTELGDVIAGVEVPAKWRPPIELTGTVIDMWYLTPFEAEAAEGLPIRLVNAWGLEAGTTYEVWSASTALEYSWLDAGTLTVTEDGKMLEGDARIPILTNIVLINPS